MTENDTSDAALRQAAIAQHRSKLARVFGMIMALAGGALLKFWCFDMVAKLKESQQAAISYDQRIILLPPCLIMMGLYLAIFGPGKPGEYRNEETNKLTKKCLVVVVVMLLVGFGFFFWFQDQLNQLGYADMR